MIEKSSSKYYVFKDYLRPGVVDWAEKPAEKALVADAPESVKKAFNEYVQKRQNRIEEGRII